MLHRIVIAFVAMAGCSQMTVTGEVVDPAGAPIANARVTVVGALCTGVADAQGRFSLPCRPGDLEIGVMQQGYVSQRVTLSAPDKRPYPLGTITLLPIPSQKGLFALDGATWVTLPPTSLAQRAAEGGSRRSTCLAEDAEPTLTLPPDATLFVNDGPDIQVFRLDADGCARHLERGTSGWTTVDTVRPPRTDETVGQSQHVIRLELQPGVYVVAPWRSGNFTRAASGSEGADTERYAAFLVGVSESP